VIQADAEVDLKKAFDSVHTAAREHNHHLLLPIPLFIDHFIATQTQFLNIITHIDDVETKIQMDLTDYQTGSEASHNNSKVDYGGLSKKLHFCNSALVELERRRDFERQLGNLLISELKADDSLSELLDRVGLYAEMSQNRDLDIRTLPRRIESQKNVVGAYDWVLSPLHPQC
jgi:hypothetical protein